MAAEATDFLASRRSLVLGTVSEAGEPEASYAPFVRRAGEGFYIYVSALSRHTANLRASRRASALLLADEQDTPEAFARVRLTFRCEVGDIARESESWCAVLDEFATRFGGVMAMIRPLTDFQLFVLRPIDGVYVRGFGQAYRFAGDDVEQLVHVRPGG